MKFVVKKVITLLDIHSNEMASKFVDYLKSKKYILKNLGKVILVYATITLGPEEVMQPFYSMQLNS